MRSDGEIERYFEERAMGGSPGFAIAFALLQLAYHQQQTAKMIDRHGPDNSHPDGIADAIDGVANNMTDIAEALANIAGSIDSLKPDE